MKFGLLLLLCALHFLPAFSQSAIHTNDVHRFWQAFDRVQQEKDSVRRVAIIQELYLDKGSQGLKDFVAKRDWKATSFIYAIDAFPAFWQSVRPKTIAATKQKRPIDRLIKKYKQLYPAFRTPDIYFLIGYLESGGTTTTKNVLLGTEILAADSSVIATGINPLLQNFFRTNKGITPLIAHEITHTQQKGGDMETDRKSNLLGFSIAEGACDFIAELLTGKTLQHPYLVYGRAHEKEVWSTFKQEMHGTATGNWLYNMGQKGIQQADLGYFMGYAICRAYYQQATDKRQAIADIIELDLEDTQALDRFLQQSGYNPQ